MDSKTELTGLKKYTNYTVTVLAFTNGGDGVKSQVHTAVTEQDVPGPPSSVKALAMSQDSILVCSFVLPFWLILAFFDYFCLDYRFHGKRLRNLMALFYNIQFT